MRFPQCFLVCELGPAIDKHSYEKSFRGQLYFPMFFFFFLTRNYYTDQCGWVRLWEDWKILTIMLPGAIFCTNLSRLVACIQPTYASCHCWLHTLVLKFRLKRREVTHDFPASKKFFFEIQQPSRFQMVNALWKIEASTEHTCVLSIFFCCRIEPVGQPESGNLYVSDWKNHW